MDVFSVLTLLIFAGMGVFVLMIIGVFILIFGLIIETRRKRQIANLNSEIYLLLLASYEENSKDETLSNYEIIKRMSATAAVSMDVAFEFFKEIDSHTLSERGK